MAEKLLDILVPAYGNASGIEKILSRIDDDERCRVIVSDDSSEIASINAIKEICLSYNATYKTGPRSGAAKNWNSLLSIASSTFSVLVHHDECFSNTKFIDELEKNSSSAEILVLPLVVKNSDNLSRFISSWQQRLLIKFFRPFGPMVNILGGPTALFIFRTSRSTTFNPALTYQIDCEWYTRILSGVREESIIFYRGTSVLSTFLSGSITDTIKFNLKEVIELDKQVLKKSSWAGLMRRWTYVGPLISFLYKVILLPSFLPFYVKRSCGIKDC